MQLNFTVKRLVATAVGAAIFFVLARFLSIPVFANTYLTLQYAALGFFAAVFGPAVGLLVGLIGHTITDLTFGYGVWWSWVIPSALVGLASGFLLKGIKIEEGEFGRRGILQFIIGSLVIHGVCWGIIAPVLDVAIFAEPADKVFVQGLIAGTGNFAAAALVGSLLLLAYAKTRPQTGSLAKE